MCMRIESGKILAKRLCASRFDSLFEFVDC
jgi:hypothetical protein